MKERPILFSGPMVRALLEGRKTQTRRVIRPQPPSALRDKFPHPRLRGDMLLWCEYADREWPCWDHHMVNPHGVPGGRLWVKESTWLWCERRPNGTTKAGRQKWHYVWQENTPPVYVADHPEKPVDDIPVTNSRGNRLMWKYKTARFMPKKVSRITLEVTEVRVQRLQEISEEDAKAEGAFFTNYGRKCFHGNGVQDVGDCPAPVKTHPQREGWSMVETEAHDQCLSTAQLAFGNLWDSINAKRGLGLDKNPWVWALTFKRVAQEQQP